MSCARALTFVEKLGWSKQKSARTGNKEKRKATNMAKKSGAEVWSQPSELTSE